jgi:hypothetical protein
MHPSRVAIERSSEIFIFVIFKEGRMNGRMKALFGGVSEGGVQLGRNDDRRTPGRPRPPSP